MATYATLSDGGGGFATTVSATNLTDAANTERIQKQLKLTQAQLEVETASKEEAQKRAAQEDKVNAEKTAQTKARAIPKRFSSRPRPRPRPTRVNGTKTIRRACLSKTTVSHRFLCAWCDLFSDFRHTRIFNFEFHFYFRFDDRGEKLSI